MKTKIFTALILLTSVPAFSQVDPVDKNKLALGGYDVVAYFVSGKALKGTSQHAVEYNHVTYLFSSSENLKTFQSNPQQYLPQYEGYCALAVSYGKKISINPETFKISQNKLYLFYNGDAGGKKVNSLDTWNKNEPRLLKKADQLWPEVKKVRYKPGDRL